MNYYICNPGLWLAWLGNLLLVKLFPKLFRTPKETVYKVVQTLPLVTTIYSLTVYQRMFFATCPSPGPLILMHVQIAWSAPSHSLLISPNAQSWLNISENGLRLIYNILISNPLLMIAINHSQLEKEKFAPYFGPIPISETDYYRKMLIVVAQPCNATFVLTMTRPRIHSSVRNNGNTTDELNWKKHIKKPARLWSEFDFPTIKILIILKSSELIPSNILHWRLPGGESRAIFEWLGDFSEALTHIVFCTHSW